MPKVTAVSPYRLNADYLNANSFVDFYNEQRYFVAPVLSWQLGKNTHFTLEGEYQDVNKSHGDLEGLPILGTVLANPLGQIPRSRNLAEPSDSVNREVSRISYNLEQRLGDNWVLRNAFQYGDNKTVANPETLLNDIEPDNRTVDRSSANYVGITKDYIIDTYSIYRLICQCVSYE